ncbi:MAG: peptidylprolyl isomerase [Candidatus Paceibacterota bacterium]|jgi:cyclophilin family peptidyl-prolyl cis-trans isomerase
MDDKSHFIFTIILLLVVVGGVGFYSSSKKSDECVGADCAVNLGSPISAVEEKTVSPANMEPKASESNSQTINNKKSMNTITLETSMGNIVFETYNNDAPKTVENFVTLAKKGFYNGVIFHRVISGFMIQGGDPTGTGMGGPGYQFADELNPNAPSYKAGYKKGVVAMANAGSNTNGSQFFIMLEDYPLPNAYTIFGKVVSGQEVVDAIGKVQTGQNDKPVIPVTILKATVAE